MSKSVLVGEKKAVSRSTNVIILIDLHQGYIAGSISLTHV